MVAELDRVDTEGPARAVEPEPVENFSQVIGGAGCESRGRGMGRSEGDVLFDGGQGVQTRLVSVVVVVGGRVPSGFDRVVAQL